MLDGDVFEWQSQRKGATYYLKKMDFVLKSGSELTQDIVFVY